MATVEFSPETGALQICQQGLIPRDSPRLILFLYRRFFIVVRNDRFGPPFNPVQDFTRDRDDRSVFDVNRGDRVKPRAAPRLPLRARLVTRSNQGPSPIPTDFTGPHWRLRLWPHELRQDESQACDFGA